MVGPSLALTRRGWSLAGAAAGLVLAARLLGAVELAVIGVGAVALIVAAVLWVRAQRPRLAVVRELHPARLHVGSDGRVDVVVTNRGHRRSPLLSLDERFGDGRRAARFLLPPLPPGAESRGAYRIPTSRRGRYRIGPLIASIADPFGLAERAVSIGHVDQATVYPRVHELATPPLAGGHRRAAVDSSRARSVALDGHEFVALREYEVGDDLRKVHWRATARTGDLFIRQDEARREPHVVVLLDARSRVHDETSFELAVEVVASVVSRLTRDGRRVEVRTTGGAVLCRADDAALGMDRLSVVEPALGDRELGLGARPPESVAGDALLVIVTGAPEPDEFAALLRSTRLRRALVLVTTRVGDAPAATVTAGAGVLRVDVTRGGVAAAWNAAVLAGPGSPTVAIAGP